MKAEQLNASLDHVQNELALALRKESRYEAVLLLQGFLIHSLALWQVSAICDVSSDFLLWFPE